MKQENLDMVERVLTKSCGKDNFEILGGPGDIRSVTVKFDKIVTTNSYNEKLTSRDWYSQFYIKEVMGVPCLQSVPVFALTKLSMRHLNAGFAHPHGGGIGHFHSACFGTGPLGDNVSRMYQGFDEKNLQGLMINIKTYLEWENNSDRHLLGYVQSDYKPPKRNPTDQEIEDIVGLIFLDKPRKNLNHLLQFHVNQFHLNFSPEFKHYLKGACDQDFISRPYDTYLKRSIPTTGVIFKGKLVFVTIMEDEDNIEVVNHTIVEKIRLKIIKKINGKVICQLKNKSVKHLTERLTEA